MNARTLRHRGAASLMALTLGLGSLAALAQTAPSAPASPTPGAGPHAHSHHHGQGMGDQRERMQAMAARRLQELKTRLQLTPAQESGWSSFTSALQARPQHASPEQHQELMRLSTPERLDRMKALRTQHQQDMNAYLERVSQATKSFYASLSPGQRKTFDDESGRMMRRHGGHGHGHGHGGEGHRHEGHGMMMPSGRG